MKMPEGLTTLTQQKWKVLSTGIRLPALIHHAIPERLSSLTPVLCLSLAVLCRGTLTSQRFRTSTLRRCANVPGSRGSDQPRCQAPKSSAYQSVISQASHRALRLAAVTQTIESTVSAHAVANSSRLQVHRPPAWQPINQPTQPSST